MQYFLTDFGNFENLVKLWTRELPNYYQNASNATRKIWKHPGTYYLCESGTHQNRKKRKLCVLGIFEKLSRSFLIIFLKMRIGKDKFSIRKISKSLDMNSISNKKHEMEIW